MHCIQLQGITVIPMSRQTSSITRRSHRGTIGTGSGPRYAKISPPSSVTGYAVVERALGRLGWHLDAAPRPVEHPPVVTAAQPFFLRNPVEQGHPTVGTPLVEQSQPALLVPEQHQRLPEELDGFHRDRKSTR